MDIKKSSRARSLFDIAFVARRRRYNQMSGARLGKTRFIHKMPMESSVGADVKIVAGCSKRPFSKAAASEAGLSRG
jgi:hypothetical protein